MLRGRCGVAGKDKIGDKNMRGNIWVAPINEKSMKCYLKWYGHVCRQEPITQLEGVHCHKHNVAGWVTLPFKKKKKKNIVACT